MSRRFMNLTAEDKARLEKIDGYVASMRGQTGVSGPTSNMSQMFTTTGEPNVAVIQQNVRDVNLAHQALSARLTNVENRVTKLERLPERDPENLGTDPEVISRAVPMNLMNAIQGTTAGLETPVVEEIEKKVSEKVSEQVTEQVTNHVNAFVTEQVQQVSDKVTEQIEQKLGEKVSEQVTERVGKIPTNVATNTKQITQLNAKVMKLDTSMRNVEKSVKRISERVEKLSSTPPQPIVQESSSDDIDYLKQQVDKLQAYGEEQVKNVLKMIKDVDDKHVTEEKKTKTTMISNASQATKEAKSLAGEIEIIKKELASMHENLVNGMSQLRQELCQELDDRLTHAHVRDLTINDSATLRHNGNLSITTSSNLIQLVPGGPGTEYILTHVNKDQYRLTTTTTSVHIAPINEPITSFQIGMPVFTTGAIHMFLTSPSTEEEGKTVGVFVPVDNSGLEEHVPGTRNPAVECITSLKTSGSWKQFLGICVERIPKGTILGGIEIQQDAVVFATHGDFYFRVNNTDIYEIGDIITFDGNKLSDDLRITTKVIQSIVGKVTGRLDDHILTVFKSS